MSIGTAATRHIEFQVMKDKNGATFGEGVFIDKRLPNAKSETENESESDSTSPFWLKVQFDCLVINANRAVMGGNVTGSSLQQYVGKRLLLVVQDGDAFTPQERDKLTFGVYTQTVRGWVPSDSERPDEIGVPVYWIAQDSERPDEVAVSSYKNETKSCDSLPISTFSFMNASLGNGSIEVRP